MGKDRKNGVLKDRAKNRVEDLEGMFCNLQSARKESRANDVVLLEEQVHQLLREWKAELDQPTPASSFQDCGSLGSFSSEMLRQLCEEQDDATSGLTPLKSEPDAQKVGSSVVPQQDFHVHHQMPQQQGFSSVDQYKVSHSGVDNMGMEFNTMVAATQLDCALFDFDSNFFSGLDGVDLSGEGVLRQISYSPPSISPPPSAFLGPKCALWDCPRPVQGCNQDYCSPYHGNLAPVEGSAGISPVLRPGGIGLKDNLLFLALKAKAEGKNVGVPDCEGAATAKSPWNSPELFDLAILEGETIREWLFFDKPRRAFESGNRKQRSLPDYNGRGWHESRKQVMNEFGGVKRSYYMDPQPMKNLEWHLFEYEINNCDASALYRLEVKLVDGRKSPKGKVADDSVADLQRQMGRLTAAPLHKRTGKGRAKSNLKNGAPNVNPAPKQLAPTSDGFEYGMGLPYKCYLVDDPMAYYIT